MPKTAVTIYGIKNCDTMKKARAWLEAHKVDYAFHDYKAEGIERTKLEGWVKEAGWETVLNRAGMSFRNLPEKDKEGLNEKKAIALMLANPSMIKRPVLERAPMLEGGPGRGQKLTPKITIGFKPDVYAKLFT